MEHIINEAQQKINNIYHDNIETEMPYKDTLIPILSPILQELKSIPPDKWVVKQTCEVHIDAYVESLSLYMLHNYIHDIVIDYPTFAVILVLVKHPFFIHIFQYNKNIEEWNEYRKLIFTELEHMKAGIPNRAGLSKLQPLLENDVIALPDSTSIYLFNHLYGFKYDEKYISVLPEAFLGEINNPDNTGFIIIHLSYNLKEISSLVLFKNIPKSHAKILNINTIEERHLYNMPEDISISAEPFTLCDSSFNVIESVDLKENWYVMLCYDDNAELSLCHYTLLRDTSYANVSKLINRKICNKINPKILNNMLHNDYVSDISFKTDPSEHVAKNLLYATTIVKTVFNSSNDQADFVCKLLSDNDELLKIIDKSEIPYFEIYMSKYSAGSVFDYESAHGYVMSYFGLDPSYHIADYA